MQLLAPASPLGSHERPPSGQEPRLASTALQRGRGSGTRSPCSTRLLSIRQDGISKCIDTPGAKPWAKCCGRQGTAYAGSLPSWPRQGFRSVSPASVPTFRGNLPRAGGGGGLVPGAPAPRAQCWAVLTPNLSGGARSGYSFFRLVYKKPRDKVPTELALM